MAKQDDYARYTIRIPADLYASLKVAAGEKSVNAEIIERLSKSFEREEDSLGAIMTDVGGLEVGELPLLLNHMNDMQKIVERVQQSVQKTQRMMAEFRPSLQIPRPTFGQVSEAIQKQIDATEQSTNKPKPSE